ncbi:HAD-IA family hydrolase [Nesterenkonia xinjiangensis]|uniref:Putative hydrolase of the HAD superfamily n=1 Tax=Nesterenkonia xinjiangensis TaxID=225327 RepID=A0A7Z0GNT7_9MICC|nr:putative hydrolase of the HAD superfamily [Nesterenkonia xinjiangensis]
MSPAGVLFDVDDTLVDLEGAMRATFRELASAHLLREGVVWEDSAWEAAESSFCGDAGQQYARYLAGELSFLEQRIARVRDAYRAAGAPVPDPQSLLHWEDGYEQAVRRRWRPFSDVPEALARLRSAGVAVGAVTNNVAAYQRAKLGIAGLGGFDVVVGTDTVGEVKPAPAIFHEGARQLDLAPASCAYVGDNPVVDGVGARDAGLESVLVDRKGIVESPEGVTKVATVEAAVDFVLGAPARVE